MRALAPFSCRRRIWVTLGASKFDNDTEKVDCVHVRGRMSEAGGPETHRPKCRTIRTSRLLPECAYGARVSGKDTRDVQIVPVHRRGLPWCKIEEIDRESIRSKEFPALRNL